MYYNTFHYDNQLIGVIGVKMPSTNTGNTGTDPNQEGNTNAEGSLSKKEVDSKVKEAFEFAAKELGMKIKFQGGYIVMDSECPAGTEEQLKKAKEECEQVAEKKV